MRLLVFLFTSRTDFQNPGVVTHDFPLQAR
jgi:hypothetical protein